MLFSTADEPHSSKVQVSSFEDSASIIGKVFITWLDPIFKKGYEKNLLHQDLGIVSNQDKSIKLHDDFITQWNLEQKRPRNRQSLWRILWRTVGYYRIFLGLSFYALYVACSFGPIIILDNLTKYLQGSISLSDGTKWTLVAFLFIFPVVASIGATQSNIVMTHIGIQFRNVLVNAIYRKSLRLSPSARQSASTGQIINMFSNDTMQIQRFLSFFNLVALAPAQIAVCLALIYLQIGPATFVGLALVVCVTPMSIVLFGFLTFLRGKKVKFTDARVKLINEVLSGIRIIKNYAWEVPFEEKIGIIRLKELEILKQSAYIIAIGFTIILMSAPILQPVLMFYTYVRLGNQLDAAKAFTSLSLFNLMQFPFTFLPFGIGMYSQSLVACRRMLDFFLAEELSPYVDRNPNSVSEDSFAIKLVHATLSWLRETDIQDSNADTAKSTNTEKNASKSDDYVKVNEDETESTTKHNRSCLTLMDLNVNVARGQLVAVVGSVGSGKSSFLSALLGELILHNGYVRVVGTISYCDQKPWILNASVKDNILFGKPYDEVRFQQAIHSASMEDDIRVLPGGILTEIGERGINLSGGQKARVALARAVYCNSDVYFLDDPLSAVDAHVGQHIFQECIKNTLKDKTRILVTHQVHLLPQCDLIIVLEDGKVKVSGTYDEICQSGIDIKNITPNADGKLSKAVDTAVSALSSDIPLVSKETDVNSDSGSRSRAASGIDSHTRIRSLSSVSETAGVIIEEIYAEVDITTVSRSNTQPYLIASDIPNALKKDGDHLEERAHPKGYDDLKSYRVIPKTEAQYDAEIEAATNESKIGYDVESNAKNPANDVTKESNTKLMTVEEQKLGDVELKTYLYYIRVGGFIYFFGVVIFMIMGQFFQVASMFWLQYWGTVTVRRENRNDELSSAENIQFLNYYAMLSCLFLVAYVMRSLFLAEHRLGTSLVMHKDLLHRVLGTSVSFFDVTPLGRILNRFSSDMNVVDEDLSQTISQMVNTLFGCFGALMAIVGSTKGTFLLLLAPMIYIYNRILTYFRKANTTIARMEAISRSPIYADFSQALVGINSIRAYHEEDRFIKHLEAQVDSNTIANVTSLIAAEWLTLRLDILGAIITLFIAILAVASNGFIPAGFLALGLSNSFQVTGLLKYCIRMVASFEAQMNSVERIMYYISSIDQEGSGFEVSPEAVSKEWPAEGAIVGKNVQLKYRDGPLVLKGVDFDIKGNEKIGIAGRTGSGKSSMMIGLFRIEEFAAGSIFIDSVDISTIPLRILRSKLGIIPQDPVMFSATVRFNLDPFNEHSDESLWTVLENVNMKDHILSLPNKLNEEVAEGGDNFSAGQRQLICIARAILRRPKILILDEATASIDNETDALVQKMVREQFKNSTVLTIAHRLHTIIDSDRIMVLDSGHLKEYDTPENLLQNENGLFKQLWDRHQTDRS